MPELMYSNRLDQWYLVYPNGRTKTIDDDLAEDMIADPDSYGVVYYGRTID